MAFQTLDPSPIGVKLRGKIFGLALVPTEGELAEPGGQQHHHVHSGTVGATLQRTEAVLTTTPLSNGRATIRRRPIRSDGGGRKSLLHKRRHHFWNRHQVSSVQNQTPPSWQYSSPSFSAWCINQDDRVWW